MPDKEAEPLLRWFEYSHLKTALQPTSTPFGVLARQLCNELPPSTERTVALRHLLDAKDAAVRAAAAAFLAE